MPRGAVARSAVVLVNNCGLPRRVARVWHVCGLTVNLGTGVALVPNWLTVVAMLERAGEESYRQEGILVLGMAWGPLS